MASFLKTGPLPHTKANTDNVTSLLNIVFATMGAIAFFMIVLSAFRFSTSAGEPEKIAAARRTILYSIVGLVVIAMAATIVNFVVDKTKTP